MKITSENLYVEKTKITGSLSDFGRIAYVTKKEKIRKQIREKTYKVIMVGYADNHTRDMYKFYNT